MRNERVLIPILHVAHDTKMFSPCVYMYSYFHRQLSDNFILSQKMQTFGLYEYKKEGSDYGFNRKRGLVTLIHNLSKSLTCFNRAESLDHNLSVIFHFCTRMTKNRQKLSTT